MQSALHISTSKSAFNFGSQWERRKEVQTFLPIKRNPYSRRISELPIPLKTSFHFEFEEEKSKKELETTSPTLLPVVIRQSDGVSRYFWDGNDIKLVSVDGKPVNFDNFDDLRDGCRRLFRSCSLGVRNFLLPREINENYLEYVKWKFLHRVFSSALQVLATQAMFRAIGIGYARSLPSAAALSWVLKDGLGRLSRCVYTASLASAFDTNLKRVRFSTSVVFSLSIGLELMTPAFPQYFLFLASIANIAKQISLACYLATGTAVHRSFAVADNLGEVSAKAQIQTVCFDNLGLMLAATLNIMLKNNQRLQAGLPFVVYPIFTAIDLYGIYMSLKHVHLQTLTKDRLEMIIDTWIQLGYVPSPAEVSKKEGVNFFPSKGSRPKWPIRIGCLNPKAQIPKLSMMAMQSLSKHDFYFVCMEVGFQRSQVVPRMQDLNMITKKKSQGLLLCLREGATTADIITGLLQACYIRERLPYKQTEILEEGSRSGITDWFKLADECKQCAKGDMKLLKEKMVELGWTCKNVLLSTHEQTRFSFVDD
ncbi:hypothetical protein OSB04_005621 [Centaurea solstitialis]|uniref:Protein root UVB sensitive/RUS domain-containing protein n=1 Tax=Centaurea solstitialis TaxID=347529 RepID=A0AA38TUA3_9ASTR|nr:hypothetical protein OSB04_005621 [Centaurea solstitialis]